MVALGWQNSDGIDRMWFSIVLSGVRTPLCACFCWVIFCDELTSPAAGFPGYPPQEVAVCGHFQLRYGLITPKWEYTARILK